MSLRIAFDLDGVFADMESALARHAEALFGPPASQVEPAVEPAGSESAPEEQGAQPVAADPDKLRLSDRNHRRLWRHVGQVENFWQTLDEIEPGTVAQLAALSVARDWEVIFLTRRPPSAGATSQVQSQLWLQSKGFPIPSVYVVQGSRGRIAAALALDFVIDDRPENCLDVVVDSKARAILVWREDEKQLPTAARRLGIGVVKSVQECLAILTEIDAAPPERPKVMDRVKRLLGLNETASV